MVISEKVGHGPDTARRSEVTGVEIRPPRFKGILLPKRYLVAAMLKAEEQYLEWRSKRDRNEKQLSGESLERLNRQIDSVHLLSEFAPKHVDISGRPDYVIYYPNRSGVDMEDIAETFGGEIGLVGSEISIEMVPFVDLEMVLTRITQVQRASMDWKRVKGEQVAQHFLPESDFAVPSPLLLTKGEDAISVSLRVLGIDRKENNRKIGTIYGTGVRFGVEQILKGNGEPLPVFGAEKQDMLKLTRNIAGAFGHKAT